MKLALIQMHCQFGNIEENIKKATEYINECVENGADLICLPEAFNTGHFGNMETLKNLAEDIDGKTICYMKELCKTNKVHLIVPIIIKTKDNKYENTAVFIDGNGEVIGSYAKTHPVGDERIHFNKGIDYPVWDSKVGKIGIAICYDMSFPETIRVLCLNGAELVIVPSAWRASHYFERWWDINLECRALDNLLYIGAVNQCGKTGDEKEYYSGKSKIVSPIGEVLGSLGNLEDGILYQDIDFSKIEKERAFNTVLIDRHPSDYEIICK